MTQINDGGPAFPTGLTPGHYSQDGMSLRDYFAGQALMGILAGGLADTVPHDDIDAGKTAATFAYNYADEMLAALGATS